MFKKLKEKLEQEESEKNSNSDTSTATSLNAGSICNISGGTTSPALIVPSYESDNEKNDKQVTTDLLVDVSVPENIQSSNFLVQEPLKSHVNVILPSSNVNSPSNNVHSPSSNVNSSSNVTNDIKQVQHCSNQPPIAVSYAEQQLKDTHKKEMDELRSKISQIISEKSQIQSERDKLASRNQDLSKQVLALQTGVKNWNEERKILESKVNSWNDLKQVYETRISVLEEEISNLKKENKLKDEENVKINFKLVDFQNESANVKKSLEETIEKLRQELKDQFQGQVSKEDHDFMINKLEETISEKNKTIKLQIQRISDLKKSIQKGDFPTTSNGPSHASSPVKNGRESVPPSTANFDRRSSSPQGAFTLPNSSLVPLNAASGAHDASCCHTNSSMCLDVNFEYLKNVIFKFISSSDHPESQKQLVKAISTLLQFDSEQEDIIRSSIDKRSSWLPSLNVIGPLNLVAPPINPSGKK